MSDSTHLILPFLEAAQAQKHVTINESLLKLGGRAHRAVLDRDLATPPHAPTLLDQAQASGMTVIGIGKISDIFAGRGITRSVKAHGNDAVFEALLAEMARTGNGSIIFANFVDFDSLYGHRRDVAGVELVVGHP